jgi:hypothetical protein
MRLTATIHKCDWCGETKVDERHSGYDRPPAGWADSGSGEFCSTACAVNADDHRNELREVQIEGKPTSVACRCGKRWSYVAAGTVHCTCGMRFTFGAS